MASRPDYVPVELKTGYWRSLRDRGCSEADAKTRMDEIEVLGIEEYWKEPDTMLF